MMTLKHVRERKEIAEQQNKNSQSGSHFMFREIKLSEIELSQRMSSFFFLLSKGREYYFLVSSLYPFYSFFRWLFYSGYYLELSIC